MQMSEGFWKKYNSSNSTSNKYSTTTTYTHHSKYKYYDSNDSQMSHCDGDGTNGRLFNGNGAIKEKCFVENRTYNK